MEKEKGKKKIKKIEKKVDKSRKDGIMGISVVLGDICYPKSEALIIPANTKGLMSRGIASRIAKSGLSGIPKAAKIIADSREVKIEECFSTMPGRLNRRGLKKIYHTVIRRLQLPLPNQPKATWLISYNSFFCAAEIFFFYP